MPAKMRLEFVAPVKDLRKAVKELLVNRDEFKGTDRATLTVRDGVLELASVGTEAAIEAVEGENGVARAPVNLLEKMIETAESYKRDRVRFTFASGVVQIERFKLRDRAISIPPKPEKPGAVPVNATPADILAVRAALDDDLKVKKQGLTTRVMTAIEKRDAAVTAAWEALKEFGVEKDEVYELVNGHVRAMARGVKKVLAAE